MSYQVLARKCRPKNFQALAGQEHVLKPLIHALQQQRLHHAYLFTGTRGVGKTTIARIFAKCLNCETGITATPCGTCATCQEIDSGRFVDLLEVDAASRTKVEDTRDLLDNVQYAPTRGRFKVYLIDEVHMLSGHSFNALLKTLEEPPAHVKFLLATTDPQKLPITVLSRCLQFNLKSLSSECIADYLQKILEAENIPSDSNAVLALAKAADGSMRDALSLLDQGIAFCQGKLNGNDINVMLGTISQQHVLDLLAALAAKNGKQILDKIAELADYAPDYDQILQELLSILQAMAIAQLVPEALHTGMGDIAKITELSRLFNKEDVQLYYQMALIGRRDLALASTARSGLEMLMLRMLAFQPAAESSQMVISSTAAKSTVNSSVSATLPIAPAIPPKSVVIAKDDVTSLPPPVDESEINENNLNWAEVLPQLQLTGVAQVLASNCALQSFSQNQLQLVIAPQHAALLNEQSKIRLTQAISQYLARPIKLTITVGTLTQETPAATQQRIANVQHAAAIQAIENDSTVQALKNMFGATVHPDLIENMG